MRWRRLLLVLVLGISAVVALSYGAARLEIVPARYNPLLPLDLNETPGPVTGLKLWRLGSEYRGCIAALEAAGAEVKAVPDFVSPQGPSCSRRDSVRVAKLSTAAMRPEEMRCGVALRLYLLERHVMQPQAKELLGAPVKAISHFGSYNCRTMRGSSWRMSEHATANAFDLRGITLADGRMLSLKADWTTSGARAVFFKRVRTGACGLFAMVLSPDYNAAHADHIHVDMGLFPGCH
jgi:hypothetical protein